MSLRGALLSFRIQRFETTVILGAAILSVLVSLIVVWIYNASGFARCQNDDQVAYLKADWTRKDADITAELARYGRAGVPLYLVYGADGADGVILPSILTEGIVVKALNKAAAKG